jgi:3-oxoadipate enol-lactonase
MQIPSFDGCSIHVQIEGPDDGPALVLCNSLGTDLSMWDAQAALFAGRFRVVRYDGRGHGESGAPEGDYSLDVLGRDALSVIDALGLTRVHWCGLSLGAMVGQWLGAHAPERIGRLVLSNTASHYPDKSLWHDRMALVRERGLAGFVDANMRRWFTPTFLAESPIAVLRMTASFLATPVAGYLGCCAALRDMDLRPLLPRIACPTMIIGGTHDVATPLAEARSIQRAIPGARLVEMDAAHLASVERPEAFAEAVLDFLGHP